MKKIIFPKLYQIPLPPKDKKTRAKTRNTRKATNLIYHIPATMFNLGKTRTKQISYTQLSPKKKINRLSHSLTKGKSVNFTTGPKTLKNTLFPEKQNTELYKDKNSIDQTAFTFNLKESLPIVNEQNLYSKLILDKMRRPKKNFDTSSSFITNSSFTNEEEKRINETTINKIKIFNGFNDSSSINPFYNSSVVIKNLYEKPHKNSVIYSNFRNKVKFIERVDELKIYEDNLSGKYKELFDKDYLTENNLENIDIDHEELNKMYIDSNQDFQIPLYLYEDDIFMENTFGNIKNKLSPNYIKDDNNYEKNLIPDFIEYQNYINTLKDIMKSMGVTLKLEDTKELDTKYYQQFLGLKDDLFDDENVDIIKEIARKMSKNSDLSRKFQNFLAIKKLKDKKKPVITSAIDSQRRTKKNKSIRKDDKSGEIDSKTGKRIPRIVSAEEPKKNELNPIQEGDNLISVSSSSEESNSSETETETETEPGYFVKKSNDKKAVDYTNIISKVIQKQHKLTVLKKRRTMEKKYSKKKKTELESINEMIGDRQRVKSKLQNILGLNNYEENDDEIDKKYAKNLLKLTRARSTKFMFYNDNNSCLDYSGLYEKPKIKIQRHFKFADLPMINEEKRNKSKGMKSEYNKIFDKKFN